MIVDSCAFVKHAELISTVFPAQAGIDSRKKIGKMFIETDSGRI
jgi:hypothetical protein